MSCSLLCQNCLLQFRALLVLLLVSFSPLALSWGTIGHKAIVLMAETQLTPSASAALKQMLDKELLTDASLWPDRMRSEKSGEAFWGYDYSASWHFINIPADTAYSETLSPNGDAFIALNSFIRLLENKPLPPGKVREGMSLFLKNDSFQSPKARRTALRFVLHLVADLHQPMHVGYTIDRGGNDTLLIWDRKKTNLHTVWDSRLVELNARDPQVLARALAEMANQLPPHTRDQLSKMPPEQWIEEILPMRAAMYSGYIPPDSDQFTAHFDQARYSKEYASVVKQQMMLAGLRLAAILNALFPEE